MNDSTTIASSELILNPDGSIYHLNLRPDDIADTIILVGDPDRVIAVSQYFDHIELKKQKREFITHTGTLQGKRLTVISTGIGTDNIDIVLNELDALVNIDLTSRKIKTEKKVLTILRIGTSGALQKEIPLDAMVISQYGLGFDNLLQFYQLDYQKEEKAIKQAALTHFAPLPVYAVSGKAQLLSQFKAYGYHGITATCSGFYAPQGRSLRAKACIPDLLDKMQSFQYSEHRIANFEMETSGIYGLGRVLGHACLSVNTIVANRALQQFSKAPYKAIDNVIQKTLDILVKSSISD